jgi:putative hydrolase of the HAD superfamily
MIKVIIFDADGVLVHGKLFSQRLERDFGISTQKTDSFFNGPFKKCLTGEDDLKEVLKSYLNEWNWFKGVDDLLEYWFAFEYEVDSDLVTYIQDLRKKGILCFLATNNEKHRFQYMLDKMGFVNCFDKTYASAHLGHKKPSVQFFAKIFEELDGVEKDEILFFDDDIENIKGAKDFGINAELYTSFENYKEKMKDYI